MATTSKAYTPWPHYFDPETHDLMHALGVAHCKFSHLEMMFDQFFGSYLGLKGRISLALTANLGNVSKVHALSIIVDEIETDLGYKDRITFAMRCFDILRENRNIVTHAVMRFDRTVDVGDQPTSKLSSSMHKFQAKGQITSSTWKLDLELVRNLADEINSMDVFFWKLIEFSMARRMGAEATQPPLPDKPPQPSKLPILNPPAQQTAKPPQKSSRKTKK